MKSKYSNYPQLANLSAPEMIALGKQKKSKVIWRAIILSGKLSLKHLKSILPFVSGVINIRLILDQISYPSKIDNNLLENIAQAVKNTATSEKETVAGFLFPKEISMANAESLAEKIDAPEVWDRFVDKRGHAMKSSKLLEIGTRHNKPRLWWIIVLRSRRFKLEQIQYIIDNHNFPSDAVFSDGYYKRELFEAILESYHYEYPLFCLGILIQYLDLGGNLGGKREYLKNNILKQVRLHELELSQLVKLYFRVREQVVLEAMFLKCVAFSKHDLSKLLKDGKEQTQDFILSKTKI